MSPPDVGVPARTGADPPALRHPDILAGLDEAQCAVVSSPAGLLAVIAAAGSGKTTVLTRRIAARVIGGDAIARHVLALTFTRQAAGELRRRLGALGLAEPIEAGTFHAIAYRSLRQRARDNGRPEPAITTDRSRLVREALGRRSAGDEVGAIVAEIDWARARLITPDEYPAVARSVRRRAPVPPTTVVAAMHGYAELKRRRGVMDMDDLLAAHLDAMRSDRAWADAQRWRFRHLVVDEAQDMNPLQHAVLEAWRGGRDDLMLVGDPRQAIYGWNGADPALLTEVERHYPGVTIMRIDRNRRSTPQIVRAAATVLTRSGQVDDARAVRADGAEVAVHTAPDQVAEAALVSGLVRSWHRPGARWSSFAVLARTNAQLPELVNALDRSGIPAVRSGRSVVQPRDAALAETFACRSYDDLVGWADRVLAAPDAAPERREVAEVLDGYLSRASAAGAASRGWRTWLELTGPFDDRNDIGSADAVAVLTFHAAKGREWSGVVVTGVEAGLVPHASALSVEQRAEEARLAYVAITRARDRVALTSAAVRDGRTTKPSPLIADIAEAATDDPIVAPPPLLRAARSATPTNALVEDLLTWRAAASAAAGLDDDTLLSDRALRAVAEARPTSPEELADAAGLGLITARRLWPRLRPILVS